MLPLTDPIHGSIFADLIKGLPAAFVALVIGAIAARIAYNQYLVAKAKLSLELFDRRLAVFQTVWEALSGVITSGVQANNWGLSTPFNNLRPSARFLFGKSMESYLDECVTNWADLDAVETSLKQPNNNTPDETMRYAQRRHDLLGWFADQAGGKAKEKFAEYLDFEKWK